jgi:hypothetical protein
MSQLRPAGKSSLIREQFQQDILRGIFSKIRFTDQTAGQPSNRFAMTRNQLILRRMIARIGCDQQRVVDVRIDTMQ